MGKIDYRRAVAPGAMAGVVGCGAMGRGIAQLLAQGGLTVRLFDAEAGVAGGARIAIFAELDKLVARGKVSVAEAASWGARLHPVRALADLGGSKLVVEAIVEDLALKRNVFAELESTADESAILATNTSSLSIAAIAAACRRPERVAGYHFFNPAPRMKVVEVVAAVRTDPGVCDALVELARRFGHTAVCARDTPGFIVNHAGRGYTTEGLMILSEGVCEPAVLDAVLRDACGFKLGPCELLDLTGLDVSHPVMESIYHQYYEEPRYRPQVLTQRMLESGLLGRKSGAGFYRYVDGSSERAPELTAPAPRVWIDRSAPQRAEQATKALAPGITLDEGTRPGEDSLIVVTPLGRDATHAIVGGGLDARRAVALDGVFPGNRVRCLFGNPGLDPAWGERARAAFSDPSHDAYLVRDSHGLIVQRVVAQIVNIACSIAERRIAFPSEIDRAVKLGLAYPHGPLAWGDLIGAATVRRILDELLAATGDPRYRPTAWLTRRAALGLPLTHAD